ncbi:RNA processing factor [Theileria equi strain WA]|uniref:RNA processing factor n=1 Tax=Theileria equi strain WA TaxID=1537102 RepID=L1LBP8_THEEQ|nr:RNA processing factor [Theileria equi strain WA]EKX72852.1 RNA processing factor [Theileria equi strain WA]|eukprot:XP_004832304.1 RNA processing factor [Theileria equi strain WA]
MAKAKPNRKAKEGKLSASAIKNKNKRERRKLRGLEPPPSAKLQRKAEERQKHRKEKRIERRKRKEDEAMGLEVERRVPETIESMRRFDETIVNDGDPEIDAEEAIDEFSGHFNGDSTPKLMITSSRRPSEKMRTFMKELLLILPNSIYYARDEHKLKALVKAGTEGGFSAILLVNQGPDKMPSGLYLCSLPSGPTTFFKLTSITFASEMKGGGVLTPTTPELVLNSFNTRLGRRIGRQLGALFPLTPEFEGRRVITFHNQRDMIFFRHHRYVFRNEKKCSLKEIGPRFTLKVHSVQVPSTCQTLNTI